MNINNWLETPDSKTVAYTLNEGYKAFSHFLITSGNEDFCTYEKIPQCRASFISTSVDMSIAEGFSYEYFKSND